MHNLLVSACGFEVVEHWKVSLLGLLHLWFLVPRDHMIHLHCFLVFLHQQNWVAFFVN